MENNQLLTPEAMEKLAAPFAPDCISHLPKGGVTLSYVGHANITARLNSVDPLWTWEPFAVDERGLPAMDYTEAGQPIGLWIRLTVLGKTIPAYGSCEPNKKEPVKELIGDCLTPDTLVRLRRGDVPICDVKIGDEALTRKGYRPVTDVWLSEPSAPVMSAQMSDGTIITGTPHHPIFVKKKGFVYLCLLRNGDILITCQKKPSHSTETNSIATPKAHADMCVITTGRPTVNSAHSIRKSGRQHTARSPQDATFITSTATHSTTPSRTLPALEPFNMAEFMDRCVSPTIAPVRSAARNSTPAPSGAASVAPPAKNHSDVLPELTAFIVPASFAETISPLRKRSRLSAAQRNASSSIAAKSTALITASSADRNSHHAATGKSAVVVSVVNVSDAGNAPVYNLTVADQNEFFANGILCHNSLRNGAMRFGVALYLWAKDGLEGDEVSQTAPAPQQGAVLQHRRPTAQPSRQNGHSAPPRAQAPQNGTQRANTPAVGGDPVSPINELCRFAGSIGVANPTPNEILHILKQQGATFQAVTAGNLALARNLVENHVKGPLPPDDDEADPFSDS